MKMLEVHQNAPTSMLKFQNFPGLIPPDPRIKRGGEGREKRKRGLGREGIGVWPTQKLSRGAPYDYIYNIYSFTKQQHYLATILFLQT
jgi:hypothetical protein